MDLTVSRPRRLAGEIVAPGDKSVSHRAVMLNSIGEGSATIKNFSPGDDCTSTMGIMRALGVEIERLSSDEGLGDTLHVRGSGTNGLREPEVFFGCWQQRDDDAFDVGDSRRTRLQIDNDRRRIAEFSSDGQDHQAVVDDGCCDSRTREQYLSSVGVRRRFAERYRL